MDWKKTVLSMIAAILIWGLFFYPTFIMTGIILVVGLEKTAVMFSGYSPEAIGVVVNVLLIGTIIIWVGVPMIITWKAVHVCQWFGAKILKFFNWR